MIKQPHGPYRVTAGVHIEPVPVKDVTATDLAGNTVQLSDGSAMEIATGNSVLYKGERYGLYIEREQGGVRRISPGELRNVRKDNPMTVTLVQSVEYDKRSKPFMSFRKLDEVFGAKFVRVYGDEPDMSQVDSLKQRIMELERKLAMQNSPEPNFNDMTERELREHAAAEEIDVSNCKTKAQLRDTIQGAMQPA